MVMRMNEVHRSWGNRLKARRLALGMTQQQLADICGLRQSTVSRIEAGACPRDTAKWLLAGALGHTVEELFPFPAIKPPFPGDIERASA